MHKSKNRGDSVKSAKKFKIGLLASAGSIVSQIIAFVSGLIVARTIGPNNYGLFVLCRNLCQTSSILSRSGFELGVIRKIRENKDNALLQASYIAHALYISGALSFSFVLLAWLWGSNYLSNNVYHYDQFNSVFSVMVILIPLLAVFRIYIGLNRAYFRIQQSVIVESILQPVSRLLIILILFIFFVDLWAVIWGTLLSFLFVICYLIYDAKKRIKIYFFSPKLLPKIDIGSYWRYSFMIAITSSVNLLLTKMDSFMIGYFNGAEEIGKYAIIQLTVPVIVVFNGSFNKMLGPTIAELAADNNYKGMASAIRQHTRWMAIGSFPLFLIFAFFGKDLLLIFGKEFTLPAITIVILASGQLVTAIFSSAGFLLSMTKSYKFEFPVLLLALFLNVFLNYLLIPKFGIVGAAVATLIALFMANILRVAIVSEIYSFFIFDKWILPPLILATSSLLLILFARNLLQDSTIAGAFIASICFCVLYVLILNSVGLSPDDKKLSKDIVTLFRKKIL
ncbi:oligosaccharide flippase family protein [Desulfogranum marinum]|uniref:oligosaccharide flippase family protein n=1 Tax=Desulfogranum marinum TaxID=453220 RepID=UPI0029C85510|nr:oligosaccharide flippase family protein [Desulfogranum marinum]